jgi:hypothetical protein
LIAETIEQQLRNGDHAIRVGRQTADHDIAALKRHACDARRVYRSSSAERAHLQLIGHVRARRRYLLDIERLCAARRAHAYYAAVDGRGAANLKRLQRSVDVHPVAHLGTNADVYRLPDLYVCRGKREPIVKRELV